MSRYIRARKSPPATSARWRNSRNIWASLVRVPGSLNTVPKDAVGTILVRSEIAGSWSILEKRRASTECVSTPRGTSSQLFVTQSDSESLSLILHPDGKWDLCRLRNCQPIAALADVEPVIGCMSQPGRDCIGFSWQPREVGFDDHTTIEVRKKHPRPGRTRGAEFETRHQLVLNRAANQQQLAELLQIMVPQKASRHMAENPANPGDMWIP